MGEEGFDQTEIRRINLFDDKEALELLALQMASYLKEAEIIGFSDIPPLRDSKDTLQRSGETFYGCFVKGRLAGAASYAIEREVLTVCRLMVHPDFFRQGIATSLLRHILGLSPDWQCAAVSTGTANVPAIRLYERFGFAKISERVIAPGVTLTEMIMVRRKS